MQAFAAACPEAPPETVLQMATVNGARALGLPGRIGQLSENSLADIITVPFAGKSADALEAVVHHACEVSASMIDGAWVIKPSTA